MSYRLYLTGVVALGLAAPALARAPVVTPTPRPAQEAPAAVKTGDGKVHHHSLTDIPDMSRAVPASELGRLPSSAEQFRTLKGEVEKTKPRVETAKATSEQLAAEAEKLRAKLIDTAARVQALEEDKRRLDKAIATLTKRETRLARSFAHDRVAVTHLLGLLERLQHDMPPVMALSADDALGAARRSMLLGASLPRVYGAAASLSRRLNALRRTRAELVQRRAQSARNAVQLAAARQSLNQLLAKKRAEADTAAARYATLAAKFDVVARQAKDLGQLLQKVATLRSESGAKAPPSGFLAAGGLKPGSLRRPVVGTLSEGGIEGVGGAKAPGITFSAGAGAQVVAPADARVLFAGRYHRTGQVLILDLGGGYDLVLAGLDRVDVKVGDQVLTGEPLGTMATGRGTTQLYVELRHGEQAMSPVPWLEVGLRKAEKS